jgi:formylglycine-generating enzyme required for sulfatase activity
MVYVAGGEFTMGNASGDEYERPPHKVTVKAFFIDQYEVTCEEYARFVKATGRTPPLGWRNGQYPAGAAQQPVTGVNWDDANAYAAWAGKRLPTEEEWEFAARGTDGRLYPWGKEWKVGMANASGASGGGIADVGTFKGLSPSGAYDMVGNAWEWTASDLKPYPGGQLSEPELAGLKVIRGGYWGSRITKATTTFRRGWPANGGDDYTNTGFRCVR